MKVIFILGSGHCGTTLLDLILDSHSKIVGLGECERVKDQRFCTCGKYPNNCSFWSRISGREKFLRTQVRRVFRTKKDFLFNRNNYLFRKDNKATFSVNDYIKLTEDIYKEVLEISNSKVIVDSSKNPDRVELLLKSPSIEPIIIHLVRDGRGVLWSYFRKKKKAMPYIWKWAMANIKIEILQKRNKIPYFYILYHDFVHNPEKTLKNILKLVNLKYEPSMLRFRSSMHHQVAGNLLRFSGPEAIKEDLTWQQKLPLKYKIIFNLLFGWLNFYYKVK